MSRLSLWRAVTLFVLFAAVFESSLASVLAVDYESDWIKASLMKPGVPFDVFLNKDSKRKIQSCVAWKKDERLFGSDATNIASRFPQDSFSSLKYIQGAPYNSDIVTYFTSISTAQISETDRKTVALKQSDGTEWSTEELVAMQLSYVKKLFERDSVEDAIETRGLKTLALVNDDPKTKSPYTQINVLGVVYDRNTGGTETEDNRGMAKLWKDAGRVKTILSANSDAMSTVESVAFDIDFKAKVTRAQFEDVCEDLHPRFARPIHDALANAGLPLENISSVILTDGSSRTPIVQVAVKAAFGEDRIALNVNADESAVLGAALYGASLCQFKTKDIRITDGLMHDIQASYLASNSPTRTIHTAVLPGGSKYGARKTLTFKRHDDLSAVRNYPDGIMSGFPHEILDAKVIGIPDITG
ncbi:actin-like ATPase domain-containing protein [Rhizopogon salebrosus TDB-379]|nr:actin-like ATPase domain-containing protein [Rhizopogon salebrosus TDB-379]